MICKLNETENEFKILLCSNISEADEFTHIS